LRPLGPSMRNGLFLAGLALVLMAPAATHAASWSTPVTVPGSSGGSLSDVAVAPDGTVAVAWGGGVVAVRSASGRWNKVQRLAARSSPSTSPDIAFDPRGDLLATWTQARSRPGTRLRGPYTVRVNTWSRRDGWGNVRVLGRALHFAGASPRLAINAKGDAIVSWRGFRRVAGGPIIEAVSTSFRPARGRFGSEQKVHDGGPYHDVQLDDQGNAYAVWTTYGGPVNRFAYRPRGQAWGAPQTFTAPMASNPTLAVAPDHSAIVAWRAASGDSAGDGIQHGAVYTAVRSPAGVFGAPVKLSDARVHDVGVAVGPGGEMLLTWGAPDVSDPPVPGVIDLRFVLRSSAGTLGSERRVPGLRAGPAAFLGDGAGVLVYGAENAIFAATMAPGAGAFGAPETIALRGLYPALGTAGRRAAVTWLDPARARLALAIRTG